MGTELKDAPKLLTALQSKTTFSKAELEAFGLDDNIDTNHFIKAGESYFKPAPLDDATCCNFIGQLHQRAEAAHGNDQAIPLHEQKRTPPQLTSQHV